jgi:hypothetical protein
MVEVLVALKGHDRLRLDAVEVEVDLPSVDSIATFSFPRVRNWRIPRGGFNVPKPGSTMVLR